MNRRQFLKRSAMTAVAVSVAPAAVLAAPATFSRGDGAWVTGGMATGGTFMVGERACETIIPPSTVKVLQGSIYGPTGPPQIYGVTLNPAFVIWAEKQRKFVRSQQSRAKWEFEWDRS